MFKEMANSDKYFLMIALANKILGNHRDRYLIYCGIKYLSR